MGLGELLGFGARVTVEYKADTKDIKAKLKDLKGDELEFAKAQLKSAEERNKALDSQKKGYELLAVGVAASAAAVALAVKGIDAYGKSSAAAGEQVKRMKDGMGAAFDSFSISIGKTVMAFEPLISGIASLVGLLGDMGVVGPAAVGALGYAITGNPKVAALLAAVGFAMQATDALATSENDAVATEYKRAGLTMRNGKWVVAAENKVAAVNMSLTGDDETGVNGDTLRKISSRVDDLIGKAVSKSLGVDQWSGGIKWNKAGKDESGFTVTNPFRTNLREDEAISPLSTGRGLGDVEIGKYDGGLGIASGINLDLLKKAGSDILAKLQGPDARHAQAESKLAKVFGPLSDFDAYRMAFDTLSGAVGSAMSAWIDGSMSAGKAFKQFVGDAVKGIAIQMAMEALKHGAYAIGALAMGDAKGAALHGTSAAKFAAGAIVAAGAAKALGTSASAAIAEQKASGPGAPSLGGGSGGGYQQQGTQTIIAYGDSFAEDSPRQRLLRAGRIVSRVRGTSGIEYA